MSLRPGFNPGLEEKRQIGLNIAGDGPVSVTLLVLDGCVSTVEPVTVLMGTGLMISRVTTRVEKVFFPVCDGFRVFQTCVVPGL